MNIADMIRHLASGSGGTSLGITVGEVTAINREARTVDVAPLDEGAPLLGMNLQANQGSSWGCVQIPRMGSYVIVGFTDYGSSGIVLLCDDVEEVRVTVSGIDSSLLVNDDGIILNGGNLGGLVKVEELTRRFNLIERDINRLKELMMSWSPIPQDGGASLKALASSWSAAPLIESTRNDYENERVRQ